MSTSGQRPDLQDSLSISKRQMQVLTAFLSTAAALFIAWPKLRHDVLSSAYMPHLYCYLGSTSLAWTHAIADTLIGLSYVSISATLAYLIYRGRSDLPFHGLFLAFAVFIIACGTSHFMEAITVWLPVYVLSAAIKVVTALSSIATAGMLPFVVPDILSLLQRARTSETRRKLLEATLLERDVAQGALKESYLASEQKVLDRTAQISRAKDGLEAEVFERRRNEEMLRQSEERFSKAFCSNPLPMSISTKSDGRYLDVNESFLALVGSERGSIVGHTMAELAIWVEPQDRITMMKRLSEQGRVIGLPTQIRASTGVVLEARVSAEQIELLGQLCVLAVTEDTTEMRLLQAQSEQSKKMEAVGRLAGGVAHDFNNLLGVIIGYSDLSIETLDLETQIAKYLVQIKLAATRGAHLTRQLLVFSRQHVVFPKLVDLNAVIHEASQLLSRVVREDIILSYETSVSVGLIKADAGQIEQILMNLVVNARDAMPDGGQITIATGSIALNDKYCLGHEPVIVGDYVMLEVRDTGSGMDEPTKAHVFEPFFTTKQPGKGTGLGLASVYGIVKQSGGYASVSSELGRGTTFKLYFPRVQGQIDSLTTPVNTDMMGGNETILLVEDETALREITASILRSAGYTVVEAESPTKAIHLADTHSETIHLLLTDVIMPHMSGVALSKRLKTSMPQLKVIFASGYGGDELAKQLSVATDAVLLSKPFSKTSLLAMVHAVLHREASSETLESRPH
jgi:two-component system, cell cycle sensor histidine kinase and response regulator CckA